MPARILCLLLVLALVASGGQALATEHSRSELEERALATALDRTGAQLDREPAGKRIEVIEVVVLDVFDDADIIPGFVNVLHVNSVQSVVRRELLFSVGAPYDLDRVSESVRSLLATEKFSVVLVVAARGTLPDSVKVLVVVRDLWSLRLNNDFAVENDRLIYLLLNPTETNVFGTHASGGLYYLLERDRSTWAGRFSLPRVGGSELQLELFAGMTWPRGGGAAEGNQGRLVYFNPLKSRYDKWAWSVSVAWLNEVTRFYRGSSLREYVVQSFDGTEERIPVVYDTHRLAGEYKLLRSYGYARKLDLALGVEADRRNYRSRRAEQFSAAAAAAFDEHVLPTRDTRLSPFVELESYTTRFHEQRNIETLSLLENWRLGHHVLLRLYPASSMLGSTRSLLGVHSAMSYTFAIGDGLVRTLAESRVDLSGAEQHDSAFMGALRVASPMLAPGRLHVDLRAVSRPHNTLQRAPFELGGDTRLRGYGFGEFYGSRLAAGTAELRTRSLSVLGAELGGAVFYDVGDAAPSSAPLRFKQSVGVGLRMLFPWFDRTVVRGDWGFPLTHGHATWPGALYVTFGQAFGMPQMPQPRTTDGVFGSDQYEL